MLETGDIKRFAHVGNYASYCRCVGSEKSSNGKNKGKGNTKIQYGPGIKAFILNLLIAQMLSLKRVQQREYCSARPHV
jgi:hypothetical protein